MATRTYFGRVEHGDRHLGADFDLLAKWSRAISLGVPMNSYHLAQLSDDDRAKLFTGPANEFRLKEGPNNTVKLETVSDARTEIDPDVMDMMRSANYLRSKERHLELLTEIENAQDMAQGAAALALSGALLKGIDGPPAEKLAKRVEDKILDAAARKVRIRWNAARAQRLIDTKASPPDWPNAASTAIDDTRESKTKKEATILRGPDWADRWNARMEGLASVAADDAVPPESAHITVEGTYPGKVISDAGITAGFSSRFPGCGDDQATPKQKPATAFTSPTDSITDSMPDYGSETSSESANWNSPKYSAGETPSSPDLDSFTGFLDEADGGVVLLPSNLAGNPPLKDEGDVATPTPASCFIHAQTRTPGGHLGTGLSQAFFVLPAGTNSMSAGNATDLAATRDPSPHLASYRLGYYCKTTVEASPGPFSPKSKTGKYHIAKEQPWKGFTCYEVVHKFSCDQLIPKYWTSKRGKERYLRHKIGELKSDDAKLRSDRFAGSVARGPIHIFVDLSNIIIGFYDNMKESRGIPVNKRVMAPLFSFKNFDTILTRDRNVAKRIVAGSLSNSYNRRWPGYMLQAQELLYEMNILERVPKPASPVRKRKPKAGTRELDPTASGADTSGDDCIMGPIRHGEQGVDELLHLKILQSAMDTVDPATMVLATGDAASAQYSDGFKKNIERVLALGWNIELYGWSRNISSAWREPEFAEKWGHKFKIVELDGLCEELFDMTIESLEH